LNDLHLRLAGARNQKPKQNINPSIRARIEKLIKYLASPFLESFFGGEGAAFSKKAPSKNAKL
jgi:hypothetical protein